MCHKQAHVQSFLYFPQIQHEHTNTLLRLQTLKTMVKNKPAVFLMSLRYKNNVVIDAKEHHEKYTAESNYNMHSLEIKK